MRQNLLSSLPPDSRPASYILTPSTVSVGLAEKKLLGKFRQRHCWLDGMHPKLNVVVRYKDSPHVSHHVYNHGISRIEVLVALQYSWPIKGPQSRVSLPINTRNTFTKIPEVGNAILVIQQIAALLISPPKTPCRRRCPACQALKISYLVWCARDRCGRWTEL